jgi:hypothetical protein
LVGYPVACGAIVRWIPIVRQRMVGWFVAHELAMVAICLGWALTPGSRGVLGNAAWGAIAIVWWVAAGRRPASNRA